MTEEDQETQRELTTFANALEVVGIPGPHLKEDDTLSNAVVAMLVAHTLLQDPQRTEAASREEIAAILKDQLVPMNEAEQAGVH